jgi:regulatory protein
VQKKPKTLAMPEARQRIYAYCAYQERTHQEVRHKLFEFGLRAEEVDGLLAQLITEGYLNEERFAKAFAGGKFRVKKWGRLKIVNELEARGLTKNCIRSGMSEIDETDYRATLTALLSKKAELIADNDLLKKKEKLAKFAIQKGYEPELVWKHVKQLIGD